MRLPVRSALVTLLASLALAPGARAATVALSAETSGEGATRFSNVSVRFTAAPGERNVVTAAADADHRFTVTDTAGLQAGEGCVQQEPTVVTCVAPPAPAQDGVTMSSQWEIEALLGDGDDRFATESAPETLVTARGQEGADTIAIAGTDLGVSAIGGGGNDILTAYRVIGGDGDDTLRIAGANARGLPGFAQGGQGRDTITGSGGDDVIEPGLDLDRVDGGGGPDFVSYDGARFPVLVDLGGSPEPGPGVDADVLANVEHATGGRADDTLLGDERDNILDSGAGNDTIRAGAGDDDVSLGAGGGIAHGEAGDDVLRGARGDQALLGGPGDDALELGGGGEDYAFGGPGNDVFRNPGARSHPFCNGGTDRIDRLQGRVDVAPDCEQVSPLGAGALALPRLTAKGVRVELRDVCLDEAGSCRVRVQLLGVGSVQAVVAKRATVRRVLRVGAAQRRRLSEGFGTFAVRAGPDGADGRRRTFRVRLG